jgi:hypothetical protein
MKYMVVERFRDAAAVYQRVRKEGRLLPEGLRFVGSWVGESLDRCYQLMESEDPALLELWMSRWRDLVTFEVVPVISSDEAAQRVSSS